MHEPGHWLLIGDARDPRILGFREALVQIEPQAQIRVHSYRDPHLPADLLHSRTPLRVRFESPSHDLEAVRRLVRRGREPCLAAGFAPLPDETLPELEAGAYLPPAQYHFGLIARLRDYEQQLQSHPHCMQMNTAANIATVSDKLRCHQLLRSHGLSVPRAWADIRCAADLWHLLEEEGLRRVFIKPRFGAGGAGILALSHLHENHLHVVTTLARAGQKFYNSLRPVHLKDRNEISRLIDWLGSDGLQVEEWIPKLHLDGRECDCRLLVIGGEIALGVVRSSAGPITNLHLNNQRHPLESLWPHLRPGCREDLQDEMRTLAALFPQATQLAVDVAIHANRRHHRILEVNAFGDFLQRVSRDGQGPYALELARFPDHDHA